MMFLMSIEKEDGETEVIEKALEEYHLMITGQEPIENIIKNPVQVMEMKHQLQIAQLQINMQKDVMALKDMELKDLKEMNKELLGIVGKAFDRKGNKVNKLNR